MVCYNISVRMAQAYWVYIRSEKSMEGFACFFFKGAASLQRPAAVHFLMRLSVCTVNTVIKSCCTAEQQWMLLKCNKWLLYWLTSGLVPAWKVRFGEIAIMMNELTQFINQKEKKGAGPCGKATTQWGYSLIVICLLFNQVSWYWWLFKVHCPGPSFHQ